ncbi:MAG: hypothetical protein IV100_23770 [Myxococcales bacterium]|nr:hypothetical protein [Myxococcales bacterium]
MMTTQLVLACVLGVAACGVSTRIDDSTGQSSDVDPASSSGEVLSASQDSSSGGLDDDLGSGNIPPDSVVSAPDAVTDSGATEPPATVTVKGQFYGTAVCTPCPGVRPYCRRTSGIHLDEPYFGSKVQAATEVAQVEAIDEFCSDFAADAGTLDLETETIQWVHAYERCSPQLNVQIRWLGACVETIPDHAGTFEYTLVRASLLCCGYHEEKPGLDAGDEGITYFRVPKTCGIAGYARATLDYVGDGSSFLCDDWLGKYPLENDDMWSEAPVDFEGHR